MGSLTWNEVGLKALQVNGIELITQLQSRLSARDIPVVGELLRIVHS